MVNDMDYEKKYKNALEWARQVMDGKTGFIRKEVEEVFPELKESEDKKIRGAIIDHLKDYNLIEWADWLEKQGEFKNIDSDDLATLENWEDFIKENKEKWQLNDWFIEATLLLIQKVKHIENNENDNSLTRESEFKVGDWVVNKLDDVWHIDSIDNKNYQTSDGKGNYNYFPISKQDEMRLWTIKDAKNGDILMAKAPFIFNGNLEGGIGCPGAHCAINTLGEFQIPTSPKHWTGHTTTPATKEQRDLLFQKMHEAGYEWNAEKKALYDKPTAWSKEDEEMARKTLVHFVATFDGDCSEKVRLASWLESLKERIQLQPKQEWSERDERFLNQTIEEVDYALNDKDMFYSGTSPIVDWLKDLKQRLGG